MHPSTSSRQSLRPALFWALAHGLLILWFFQQTLVQAADDVLPSLRGPLAVAFVIQALFLGLVAFVATLPLLGLRKGYAIAAPLLIGLLCAFFFVDSLVYESLGFHINGLVLTVAMQPGGGLAETGLPQGEVALFLGVLLAALAADVWLGSWLLRRFSTSRRTWTWALAVLCLWTCERLGSAALIFGGGPPMEAATTTLPLQPLVRANKQLAALTGKRPVTELTLGGLPQVGVPPGELEASGVHFTRTPDVLFLLIESLPADFLSEEVMPNLWRRSQQGTVFDRHYSAAASTQFSLYSILFGLDAHRRDAVIGAGRSPMLFPALKRSGYQLHLLAASSVDWMDLKETVFHEVTDGLETSFQGNGHERDVEMVERAERIVAATQPEEPLFLFLFFAGTHFNYTYPERSAIFEPAWDGKGTLMASRVEPALILNRARNAAREVDAKVEAFLQRYEASRGSSPLLIITGDHGEEFNENGRLGHASDVSVAQLHVPMVIFDETLPPGRSENPTGHVDLLPTLFSLLGDANDPALYSDGMAMQRAPADRFVLATVGWERKFALIGKELKVTFKESERSMRGVRISDPDDRPLPDGEARFAVEAPRLLRRMRGQAQTRAIARVIEPSSEEERGEPGVGP